MTEKKPGNGFLPWIISMKVDERTDVASSVSCRPLYPLSVLIFISCSFLLLLYQLCNTCGLAAALCELLGTCKATVTADLLFPADGIDRFREAIDPLM